MAGPTRDLREHNPDGGTVLERALRRVMRRSDAQRLFAIAMKEKDSAQRAIVALPPSSGPLCPGSRARLELLYRRERDALLTYLSRQVGCELADDLAQEVFLRAARSSQLAGLRNPGGFLHRIARNLLVDRARRDNSGAMTVGLLDAPEAALEPEQEKRLEARETLDAYQRILTGLPPKTARIFAMSRQERMTYRQISDELMIAPATVEYHMMRALRCLRSGLGDPQTQDPEGP